MNQHQKISPFLWFDGQAEEAIRFYTSVFPDASIEQLNHAGPGGPVVSGSFFIQGQRFMALNGGPQFTFSPAISFFIECEDQQEVDRLWNALSEGGEQQQCGWVKDKFGVSWQVVPKVLGKLLFNESDPASAQRVLQAMLHMTRLDIAALQQAAAG